MIIMEMILRMFQLGVASFRNAWKNQEHDLHEPLESSNLKFRWGEILNHGHLDRSSHRICCESPRPRHKARVSNGRVSNGLTDLSPSDKESGSAWHSTFWGFPKARNRKIRHSPEKKCRTPKSSDFVWRFSSGSFGFWELFKLRFVAPTWMSLPGQPPAMSWIHWSSLRQFRLEDAHASTTSCTLIWQWTIVTAYPQAGGDVNF